MRPFCDLMLTQDLLLRPPHEDELMPDSARDLDPLKVIEVRATGNTAGFIGETGHGPWLELEPAQRNRGRGTETLFAWLGALLAERDEIWIRGDNEPARGLLRKFAFSPTTGDRWRSTEQTRARLKGMASAHHRRYRQRVHMVMLELGIPDDFSAVSGLPLVDEANRLVSIGRDVFDRIQYLTPGAAQAWRQMVAAADDDGVDLQVVSAFRGFDYQTGLIRRKLEKGQPIDRILRVSAAPGFSEHHSGCAVDVTAPGCPALEETFENSDAFAWLKRHADRFRFTLSYPRDNPHGITYEPWHWRWSPPRASTR